MMTSRGAQGGPAITDRHRAVFALIADQVATSYGIEVEDLVGSSRAEKHAWPRKVLYFTLRERFDWSFPVIGALIGRDHSTVSVGVERVRRRMAIDGDERYIVGSLLRGTLPLSSNQGAEQELLEVLTELRHMRDVSDRLIARVEARLSSGWGSRAGER